MQATKGDIRLRIFRDDCNDSPRDWDNMGTIVSFHTKYNLGEDHNFEDSQEFHDVINEKDYIILPLYIYDHSGITINTTGFSCPWDSGQFGWIYVSKHYVRENYGVKKISPKLRKRVEELLKAEIETFDKFLIGDVYGFVLDRKVVCDCCDNVEYEDIDSCWGFYGTDWKENGLGESLGDNADLLDDLDDGYCELIS